MTHASFTTDKNARFFGWRVVSGAFVLAVFGWGVGFYGPPVFLGVIHKDTGWPVALISSAVTLHFLVGAFMGGVLPSVHRRFGIAATTKAGAVLLAAGACGWSVATAPWHLFIAALLSGSGWGTMSAAALNAIVSPWFVHNRPAALSMAYNGGSIGGVLFSPLWVAAIGALNFPLAAMLIGCVMVATMWVLANILFSHTPQSLGVLPDGEAHLKRTEKRAAFADRPSLPGAMLWRDRTFQTLTATMALGLFAQIGLVSHLFSALLPVLGAQSAGFAMGLVTVMAVTGRTLLGWLMPPTADRRLFACAGYALQCAGSVVLLLAASTSVPLIILGVVLFGVGFGNATSLPPLIAQAEFNEDDVPRAVALVVAVGQGFYAFAPAVFGIIQELAAQRFGSGTASIFITAALFQAGAICACLAGRQKFPGSGCPPLPRVAKARCEHIKLSRARTAGRRLHMADDGKALLESIEQFALGASLEDLADEGAAR